MLITLPFHINFLIYLDLKMDRTKLNAWSSFCLCEIIVFKRKLGGK